MVHIGGECHVNLSLFALLTVIVYAVLRSSSWTRFDVHVSPWSGGRYMFRLREQNIAVLFLQARAPEGCSRFFLQTHRIPLDASTLNLTNVPHPDFDFSRHRQARTGARAGRSPVLD